MPPCTPSPPLQPPLTPTPTPPPQARLAASMWGGGGFYPVLPWSSIVLESVPEASLVAGRSRPTGATAPPVGGPPTAEDVRAAKVRALVGFGCVRGWGGVRRGLWV